MKVRPWEKSQNICQVSIETLRQRCTQFLRQETDAKTLWFPDESEFCPTAQSGDRVDVVFFGGFLIRFLETGNWPTATFRIWVLCSSVKEVMVRLLGLPVNSIGVIPRDQLFPPSANPIPLPNRQQPFQFVFSGRLSPTKNIEALLWAVYFLQKNYSYPAGLTLFGNFDNLIHPDQGRRRNLDFESQILKIISELDWNIRPEWYPHLDAQDWYRRPIQNPVFVSLSTFINEDFGVSLAQAQELGWPCVLSDWGAHQEVRGSHGVRIHPAWIAHSHEPSPVIRAQSRALAARIHHTWGIEPPPVPPLEKLSFPDPLAWHQIDALRRKFLQEWGDDCHLIYREGLDRFADTQTGKAFFARYRSLFSGKLQDRSTLIVINDFNSDPLYRSIESTSQACLEAEIFHGNDVVLVSIRDLFQPDRISILLQAKKVIVPFYSPVILPLLRTLAQLIGDIPIVLYCHSSQDTAQITAGSFLRRHDQVVDRSRLGGL